MLAHGMGPDVATAMTHTSFAHRAALQGSVMGFDKTFILQAITFLVVLPLLYFLRVQTDGKPAHVEMAME
jgi:hypothetical protein